MTTLYAALLGAAAAALFQYLVARRRARAGRAAMLRAIVAEVGVLAAVLRTQYRPGHLTPLGERIARDPKTVVFPLDPTLNFFTVFEGLSGRLGQLTEEHAAAAVEFYTYYKVALSLASSSDRATDVDDALIDLVLDLGDRIAAFPADGRLGAGRDVDPDRSTGDRP